MAPNDRRRVLDELKFSRPLRLFQNNRRPIPISERPHDAITSGQSFGVEKTAAGTHPAPPVSRGAIELAAARRNVHEQTLPFRIIFLNALNGIRVIPQRDFSGAMRGEETIERTTRVKHRGRFGRK